MRTAILFSGQLRTLAQCFPYQRAAVYRHYPAAEFFLCLQDSPAVIPAINDTLIATYGSQRVHIHQVADPAMDPYLTPELSAAWHRAPYANAAPAHQLLLQHWSQRQVWSFFTSLRNPEDYATIIRMRCDNKFLSYEPPKPHRCAEPFFNTAFTPWWGRFSGANDRFAVMGSEAAGSYFTLWDEIAALIAEGYAFHPETLLKAKLERDHVHHRDDLKAEFSTLRPDGTERWPEITPIDIAHAALRAA